MCDFRDLNRSRFDSPLSLSLSLFRLFKKSHEIDDNVNTKDEDRDKLKIKRRFERKYNKGGQKWKRREEGWKKK